MPNQILIKEMNWIFWLHSSKNTNKSITLFLNQITIEAIKFMMEQNGLTDADLGIILNSRSRVTEIFKRKRALTIKQIRLLTENLHIPASVLIKEYALEQ